MAKSEDNGPDTATAAKHSAGKARRRESSVVAALADTPAMLTKARLDSRQEGLGGKRRAAGPELSDSSREGTELEKAYEEAEPTECEAAPE